MASENDRGFFLGMVVAAVLIVFAWIFVWIGYTWAESDLLEYRRTTNVIYQHYNVNGGEGRFEHIKSGKTSKSQRCVHEE